MREEALAAKLAGNDLNDFWQLANNRNKSVTMSTVIDGVTGVENVTEVWRSKFHELFNSSPNNLNTTNLHDNIHHDQYEFITQDQVKVALGKLSVNKAVGADGIPAEVLRAASGAFLRFLTILVNAMLRHRYIPDIVLAVILSPILKSRLKDATLSKSYRPIAIATAFSKLLETLILSKCGEYFKCEQNQFGFKTGHSTDLCIYTLKETINYYTSLGSPVFIAFLDLEKAFDKVNHEKLFKILLKRKTPPYIVEFLMYWYAQQQFQIRWNGKLSHGFRTTNGIRQGGLVSPFLFNIYMDGLSYKLNRSGIGCYINNVCVNHICYADDIVVLSPSVVALQRILDMCNDYADVHDMKFSVGPEGKSQCMICWPRKWTHKFLPKFILAGTLLPIVESYEYLGYTICDSQVDNEEMMKRMRKLYSTGNMIINKFRNCSEDVKIMMFKTYFSNIYCCPLWCNYSVNTFGRLKVAHNNIFRSLMNQTRDISISAYFVTCNVKNFDNLLRSNAYSFLNRVVSSQNKLVKAVSAEGCRMYSSIWNHINKLLHANDIIYYW